MTSSVDVRTRLVRTLRRDLVGPGPGDTDIEREQLRDEPSRWYLTGFIAPTEDAAEATVEEEPDPEQELDLDQNRVDSSTSAGGAPDREADDPPPRRKFWRATAIGLTVLVPVSEQSRNVPFSSKVEMSPSAVE
jgi:hypothetical protein